MTSLASLTLVALLSATVPIGGDAQPTESSPALEVAHPVSSIQELTLQSEVLGEERTLLVRLPHGYDSGEERFPVLFVLDAEWHFNVATADVELLSECSYISSHPAPPLIVVGIVNRDRNRDFTPTQSPEFRGMRFSTSGGAEAFRRFMTEEVVPAIDQKYRTHPYRILAGWSLGGLFTIDTLLGGTSDFGAFLAISPSLWWDDGLIPRTFAAKEERTGPGGPTKLIVTLGTAEKGSMVDTSTRQFLADLDSRPLPDTTVELVPIEGLGHNYSPKMAYFLGLASIFADWTVPPDTLAKGLDAVDDYYESLSERVHFAVAPAEDAYSTLGWKLFEEGRHDDARDVFVAWTSRHPESALAMASIGAFYKETGEEEKALSLLSKAVELERASADPRSAFVADLERDINALESTAPPARE